MSASLLMLFDDIAAIMDDVAVMTKMAAKKTAGVVGDDLALNANAISEGKTPAERELPIVWAVAKGSFINKLILIPIAILLSIFAPALIQPLLMIGGAFLCFEGVEKILHKWLHKNHDAPSEVVESVDEKTKIKGAIRTDFILSAEIIIIALGVSTAASKSIMTQIISLSLIGIGMTILVYGLVALIVKADDFGLHLQKSNKASHIKTGRAIIFTMPYVMKTLAIAGTIAMFLVGGGIFTHQEWFKPIANTLSFIPKPSFIMDGLVGIVIGMICVALWTIVQKMLPKKNMAH